MKLLASLLVLSACGDGGSQPSNDSVAACVPATDTCSGDLVCVAGACMDAFPRAYVMKDVAITLPGTHAGAPWDVSDNPDPYIAIAVDGTIAVSSTPASNTLMQTFPGPFDITLGAVLTVSIYDEDGATDELGYECATPVSAAQLRSHAIACSAAEGSVSFEIDPK